MDPAQLANLLRATLSADQCAEATQQLHGLQTASGFGPTLLQVSAESTVEAPIKQAAAVALKNLCLKSWAPKPSEDEAQTVFTIEDHDKATIRESIIEVLIKAPAEIQVLLAECVRHLIKVDFPARWPEIAKKAVLYLKSPQEELWTGALLCVYQLAKNFNSKNSDEFHAMEAAMVELLPMCYQKMMQVFDDQSEAAVLVQKQILKIFRALTRYFISTDLIPQETYTDWMDMILRVVDRPVPPGSNQVGEDNRKESVWWKAKKWALHIILNHSQLLGHQKAARYQFAAFYNQRFSARILEAVLRVLEGFAMEEYISAPVLQESLCCIRIALNSGVKGGINGKNNRSNGEEIKELNGENKGNNGVNNGDNNGDNNCDNNGDSNGDNKENNDGNNGDNIQTKESNGDNNGQKNGVSNGVHNGGLNGNLPMLQPHLPNIISQVLLPIMAHDETAEKMWSQDPTEYSRIRFVANKTTLHGVACDLLDWILVQCPDLFSFVLDSIFPLLTDDDPAAKTTAVYILGKIVLQFKYQSVDALVVRLMHDHIFKEIESKCTYLKATACWFMRQFFEIEHHCETGVIQALGLLLHVLGEDTECEIRLQAAHAIDHILMQPHHEDLIRPHVAYIIKQYLDIIYKSEQFELMGLIDRTISRCHEDIVPIAVEVCTGLSQTFADLVASEESERRLAAIRNVLNSLDMLSSVIEDEKEALLHIEDFVFRIIVFVLENNINVLFGETFALIQALTAVYVTPGMWKVFDMFYDFVKSDSLPVYFDMISPILYNIIVKDPEGFTANHRHLEIVYNACENVLTSDAVHGGDCYPATKLLECVLLQYHGQLDSAIPSFCHLAMTFLLKKDRAYIRVNYLQVLVAALYYNPTLFLNIMNRLIPNSERLQTFGDEFFMEWFDLLEFCSWTHIRKLCVLALCTLLQIPIDMRLPCVLRHVDDIIPALVVLLEQQHKRYTPLKKDNALLAPESAEDADEVGSDDEEGGSSGIGSLTEVYETVFEYSESYIDEFEVFKKVLVEIQENDAQWFSVLTRNLTQAQRSAVEEIFKIATQRKAGPAMVLRL